VSPFVPASWSRLFEEFHCSECGGREVYISRPRGFFEKHILALFLLRPVRCERCYRRSFALKTVPAMERQHHAHSEPENQTAQAIGHKGRVA